MPLNNVNRLNITINVTSKYQDDSKVLFINHVEQTGNGNVIIKVSEGRIKKIIPVFDSEKEKITFKYQIQLDGYVTDKFQSALFTDKGEISDYLFLRVEIESLRRGL